MFVPCAALLAWTGLAGLSQDIALARIGDEWKYLNGINPSAESLAGWEQLGYDDSHWFAGRSGFSVGYNSSQATWLPPTSTHAAAILFRRRIDIADPAGVKWLTLRVDYTDGFVAYLNGFEVARRNLEGAPGSGVSLERLATNYHACGQPEEFDLSSFTPLLRAGPNTLAIQLHSALPGDAGLCLSAELMANFNRAPYIQNTSSNRVEIAWKTPVPATTLLEFGATPALGAAVVDTNEVTKHLVVLTNLAPDSLYFYQAGAGAGSQTAYAPIESFKTFKPSGPIRFVVFGDGGWNSLAQYQVAEVMRQAAPDFVVETGDTVYTSFTAALADPRCFSVYQPQMKDTPFFFAIGNHDIYAGITNYLDAFYLPTNSVSLADHAAAGTSPEHYYSFDHGDAHIVVLYIPYFTQHQPAVDDPQYRWLVNDLATTLQPWKIVVTHLPMFSSSAHRLDDLNLNGIPDRLDVQNVFLPVLSRYGVQVVLSGHEHGYERFNPTNGVHCITTAGGGVPLYGFTQLDSASALFWARYNCLAFRIDGDSLEMQALGVDGKPFDALSIQRRPPPPRSYAAAWFSPPMESGPANDGDGNIFGQTFAFLGEPIPSFTGTFSNLGRAYVNNDSTNLYVGLERVMIYGNNNIFLFIEAPRLPGVADLATAGNGVIDPDGQGADGLDFLANLSFARFTPGIGCILGDEFADGQLRSFARTNLALNTGQGVFRLDAALSDVPGARLQQFNLSPQIGGAIGEENANFIIVSIPLTELGNLEPGESVRIGAVVAGPGFDPVRQTRDLDTGYLGKAFHGGDQGAAVLEGLEVRLALEPGLEVPLRLRVEDGSGQVLRISWTGQPGRTYQVQSSRASAPGFEDVPGAVLSAGGTPATLSYDLPLRRPAESWQFYRVRTFP